MSALLTVTALTMAEPGITKKSEFKDSDGADYFQMRTVKISIDFDRKIAVSEKDAGDIVFVRESSSSVLKEVKGYCVRANYKGDVGLRITDTRNRGFFALDNDRQDSIPLNVGIMDKLANREIKSVRPNKLIIISAADVGYDCVGGSATTELEVAGDFDAGKHASGHYQTILNLTFSAR